MTKQGRFLMVISVQLELTKLSRLENQLGRTFIRLHFEGTQNTKSFQTLSDKLKSKR